VLTGTGAGKTQLVVKGPGPGLTVTWTVRVVAGNVKLTASRVGLPIGRRYAVKASYADDAGTLIAPATGLTWTSDNPAVATVGDDGTIAATGYGRARVTATAPGGKRATVDVFVQAELVVSSSRSGRFQLYVAERSNLAQLRKISTDTAGASDPAFSNDGSRIAYTALRGGRRDIYVMDADGTNPSALANAPGSEGRPQFTPDGSAVVFQSDRSGHSQIYVQPLGAAAAVQLTQEPAVNTLPTVSPDGETIAFVSSRDGGTNIWLMSKDGSNQRAFTRTAGLGRTTAPHFLRDGSLAYLVETKSAGRTTTQVVKADLPTGRVTPLTGTELLIADFGVTLGGDLLALVVNVQAGGRPFYRVYVQPVGPGATAVPVPTTGAEQMVTPALMP
jgi:dipeptidyl aminopeptidase/acylaminoacyl peptidase